MLKHIASLNEESPKADLRKLVRRTVEEILNGLLDEEADCLVGAKCYEHTANREAYRAGHYERKLATISGEVTILMPKLKGMRFTAATISNLNEKAFEAVEAWRPPPERAYPYVYVDCIYLKRSWIGSYENVAAMVAIGVNDDGYREVIGAAEGFAESSERWRELLSWLKLRGPHGVRMFTGDKAAGMVGSIAEVFPGAAYQRHTVRFYRNVLARVLKSKRPRVAACSRRHTR